ncbi:MAG TPA: DUF3500 domain-containing protein [Desulfuromonadales bacterium]|jgi:hypothetical protein
MLTAARNFLDSLESHQQRRVLYPLGDPERFNWNYMPGPRRGVPLREMTEAQRQSALALFKSALSRQGYEKATGIMALELILGELEGRGAGDRVRDPGSYFLTLFGTLRQGEPWGWRIDGHHLSLTFTAVTQELVATTPAFRGANPAEVPNGPAQGWRVLRDEEELGRQLLLAFEASQREQALIAVTAPRDIITGTGRDILIAEPGGLSAAEMTPAQRESLMQLVGLYACNLRDDLAEAHLKRIRRAGVDKLHFAWAGGAARGEGHYYRIHGPTVLIEYDNTQNNANHIHTVMRDLENDFGLDLLRRHYAESCH